MTILVKVPANRCQLHGCQEAGPGQPLPGLVPSSVAWFWSWEPLNHGGPSVAPGLLHGCERQWPPW